MAANPSAGVNAFIGNREQARGQADKFGQPVQHHLSHGVPLRVAHQENQKPGLIANPDDSLATRRQQRRRELGNEVRIVGPPTIYNPAELPPMKRSATTLIESAQTATQAGTVENIASLASHVASFHPFSSKYHSHAPFDDTDTISVMTTDTDCINGNEGDDYYITLATDYNKRDAASNPNLEHVSSEHAEQMRGQIMPPGEDEEDLAEGGKYGEVQGRDIGMELEPDWRESVAEEKQRYYKEHRPESAERITSHGNHTGTSHYEQHHYAESSYCDNDNDDNMSYHRPDGGLSPQQLAEADAGARTPTQLKSTAGQSMHMPRVPSVSSATGIIGEARVQEVVTTGRARKINSTRSAAGKVQVTKTENKVEEHNAINALAPPGKATHATKKVDKGKQAIRNTDLVIQVRSCTPNDTFQNTKGTSFGSSSPSETSEHELAIPDTGAPTARKRDFEDSLDYTREQLAGMSYTDLDAQPFLHDPKEPSQEPARDENGVTPSLEQRLSKMTDMSEDQCKAMFAAMTDAENEATGRWFVAKMKEDVERLVRAKHHRRMIALKYEHEIKRRNALVKAKTKDVENELESLKTGLGSLMPQDKKGQANATSTTAAEKKKATKKTGT